LLAVAGRYAFRKWAAISAQAAPGAETARRPLPGRTVWQANRERMERGASAVSDLPPYRSGCGALIGSAWRHCWVSTPAHINFFDTAQTTAGSDKTPGALQAPVCGRAI